MHQNSSSLLKRIARLSLGLACLTTTLCVYADYTIDANGIGFVGKGDVQSALGWNDAELQLNAENVVFTYESVDEYVAVGQFSNLQGHPQTLVVHTVTHEISTGMSGDLSSSTRRNPKGAVTGFNLLGWIGTPTVYGDPVPQVGDHCPGGNQGNGVYISVTKVSSTGGLYANGVLIPPPSS